MKLVAGIVVLVTALIISGVAEFFSIVGLMALFPGAGGLIILMGVALGIGKLVAAAWAKAYWKSKNFNPLMRIYMVSATALLMSITSFGIYGFLAAGHLQQQGPIAQNQLAVKNLQSKLAAKQATAERLNSRMSMLDKNSEAFLATGNANKGLYGLQKVKQDRVAIEKAIKDNDAEIEKINAELLPVQTKSIEVTAKLGTIQYVADLFGEKNPEVAVMAMISMLTAVFDPLALALMLAALITLTEYFKERGERAFVPDMSPQMLPATPSLPEDVSEISTVPTESPTEEIIPENREEPPTQGNRELLIDLLGSDPDFLNELIGIIEDYKRPSVQTSPDGKKNINADGASSGWLPIPQ